MTQLDIQIRHSSKLPGFSFVVWVIVLPYINLKQARSCYIGPGSGSDPGSHAVRLSHVPACSGDVQRETDVAAQPFYHAHRRILAVFRFLTHGLPTLDQQFESHGRGFSRVQASWVNMARDAKNHAPVMIFMEFS
jgi:hypothetical protein